MSSTEVTIQNSSELDNLSDQVVESVTILRFVSECCNELTSLNLNRFNKLQSIEIGDNCFENVDTFSIDGLNELISLKIGDKSFTKKEFSIVWELDGEVNNPNRSFSISNCIELESIEIGESSFSDYGGGFELRNLPKLSTIKIGKIGSESGNFYYSSFVIKGIIDMILLMNRSSKFEFDWIRWWCIWWFFINRDIKYLNNLNE